MPDGIGIDKEPPDKFIGDAVAIDMSTIQTGQGITSSDLEKCLNIVKSGDIILFYTGLVPKLDSKDIRISYKKEYEKIEGNFNIGTFCCRVDCRPQYKMCRNRYMECRERRFYRRTNT